MALIYRVGNLLEQTECMVIGHQANCRGTLADGTASGIARSIGEIYPEAKEADANCDLSSKDRLGKYSVALSTGTNGIEKVIFNLYGQYNPGRNTDYRALYTSVRHMIVGLSEEDKEKLKIALPFKIGCGIGGGDWDFVSEFLERLSVEQNRDIYIYASPEHLSGDDMDYIIQRLKGEEIDKLMKYLEGAE